MEITRDGLNSKLEQLKAAGFTPTEIVLTQDDALEVVCISTCFGTIDAGVTILEFTFDGVIMSVDPEAQESIIKVKLH